MKLPLKKPWFWTSLGLIIAFSSFILAGAKFLSNDSMFYVGGFGGFLVIVGSIWAIKERM